MVQIIHQKRLSAQIFNLLSRKTPFQELDSSFDAWKMQVFRLIDFSKAARAQHAYQSIIPKVLTKSMYHGNVFLCTIFYTITNTNLIMSLIAESIYYFIKKQQVEVQIFLSSCANSYCPPA